MKNSINTKIVYVTPAEFHAMNEDNFMDILGIHGHHWHAYGPLQWDGKTKNQVKLTDIGVNGKSNHLIVRFTKP